MNLKYCYYLLILMFFSSCFSTASYNLYSGHADNKVQIHKDKKYVLVNNNILTTDETYNDKIDHDFSNLIGENLLKRSSLFFLEFDNNKFITKLNLDENTLSGIRRTSDADYLILIRTFGKNNNGNTIKKEPLIRSEDVSNYDIYREYHVILQLYDLNLKKIIYSKESISLLKRVSYSSVTPTQISQLNQTYNKLFNDFQKSIH